MKKKSSKNTVIVVNNFIINSENVLDVTKLFQRFCDKLKCRIKMTTSAFKVAQR